MNYYNYYDSTSVTSQVGGIFAYMGIVMLISSIVSLLMIVSMWKIFKKAGKNGWEAIIPIYNIVVLLQTVELPAWYIILFVVPFANIYVMFKMYIELAHKFGKSTGFGVATVFFSVVCLPLLAFGDSVYQSSTQGKVPTYSNTNFDPVTHTIINNNMSQPTSSVYVDNQSTIPVTPIVNDQQSTTSSINSAIKHCSKCGQQLNNDASFCFMCGNKL